MTASYFYPWWRLYATPEAENRAWIAQQFANGVCTWLHINGGYSEIFDRRALAPMREVLARQARWEPYFDGAVSAAQVALVYSRYTQDNYAGEDTHGAYLDHVRGYYCALQEAHVPFDVVSDKFVDDALLARYRVLVLPNCACLSDEAAATIERFVKAGGNLPIIGLLSVGSLLAGLVLLIGRRRAQAAIAEAAINQKTGEPTQIQNIETRKIHPRTFHIDPSGRMLVAQHNLPVPVRDGDDVKIVQAGLSVFRIGADGKLDFVRTYDVDVGNKTMFWMGMVPL